MSEESTARGPGALGLVRRHPVLSAIFVVCIALGTTLGALYLPAEWSMLRRLLGGAVAGGGIAVFLTVSRLFD